MYKKFIPCCYFPTTVVLLDDEFSFLNSVQSALGKKIALQCFQTSEATTHFLQNTVSPATLIERWKLHPHLDNRTRDFDIDVQKIREEMYHSERFNQVAVVIVDYAMPRLNGIEFCKTLQDMPVKKVLLTGEADEKIAVEAFNQGIINQFIRKDTPSYLERLQTVITDLEELYFQDLSKDVVARLKNNPDGLPYCLDDPAFVTFFNQCITTYHPTEYYLTGSSGSFIFLNFDGAPSWLVVKDESEMQSYYEIAALADEQPSDFVLNTLKNRQCVPYFYNEEEKEREWDNYLHPADMIQGKTTHYYTAYIDNSETYQIKNMNNVVSYEKFLEKLD